MEHFIIWMQVLFCLASCSGTIHGRLFPQTFNSRRNDGYKENYRPKLSQMKVDEKFQTRYFMQPIDHFDALYTATYKQRYLISTEYWDRHGGPIFFYTGNEGNIVWFSRNTGFMIEMAAKFRAMLVFAEHRYYGKSMPFGNQSYKDPLKMSFLTSEQALADYAKLVGHLKSSINGAHNSSVVAFGGSYGGMLAAWFRMKYPGVVDGSIAASAPIWQFTGLSSCDGAYKVITNTFERASVHCPRNIRISWDAIDELSRSESGLKFMTDELKMCSPLNSSNLSDFKNWLSETWFDLAMVEYPYPADFLQPLPAWPVKQTCLPLDTTFPSDKALISGLAKALQVYHNYTGQLSCFNISVSPSGSVGTVGWSYQSCTEMVMPSCTNGITDMFPPVNWNFTQYSQDCYKTWKVYPRQDWIKTVYGGKKIQSASNIVFSNGLLDPWSAGGVQKSISDSLVAVIISDGAHHLDLRSSNPADPPSVIQARHIEALYIKKWLEEK